MNKKILIIDDEADLSKVLGMTLSLLDYDCKSTTSTKEAMELLKFEKFDLVICDVVMPEISGPDFFKQAKSELSALPEFLFYSGLIEQPLEDSYTDGVIGFLSKPFRLETFIRSLPPHLQTTAALAEV